VIYDSSTYCTISRGCRMHSISCFVISVGVWVIYLKVCAIYLCSGFGHARAARKSNRLCQQWCGRDAQSRVPVLRIARETAITSLLRARCGFLLVPLVLLVPLLLLILLVLLGTTTSTTSTTNATGTTSTINITSTLVRALVARWAGQRDGMGWRCRWACRILVLASRLALATCWRFDIVCTTIV
jgi:hypothetical protein